MKEVIDDEDCTDLVAEDVPEDSVEILNGTTGNPVEEKNESGEEERGFELRTVELLVVELVVELVVTEMVVTGLVVTELVVDELVDKRSVELERLPELVVDLDDEFDPTVIIENVVEATTDEGVKVRIG